MMSSDADRPRSSIAIAAIIAVRIFVGGCVTRMVRAAAEIEERAAVAAGRSAKKVNVLPVPGAFNRDLAAEQARDLAADREAKPGAAVLARRAHVGLLERFEDHVVLVGRDADAGVGDRERARTARRTRRRSVALDAR